MGLSQNLQGEIFQKVEDGGGILNFHNRNGEKRHLVETLLNDIGYFGSKMKKSRTSKEEKERKQA